MKDLKMPKGYQTQSGGGDKTQPATFQGEIVQRWKDAKDKAGYQSIIDLCYEAGKMSSYEFVVSSLTLEKK
ncbi:hypothetical protein ES703_17976 [subsurface metagenome]